MRRLNQNPFENCQKNRTTFINIVSIKLISIRFHFTIAFVLFIYLVTLFSQIGVTSGLTRKQPSTAFHPLTYISLEDQEVSGCGFVNPVDYKTIVFISEKPTDSLVKDRKSIKVKSATVYRENFEDFVDKMEDLGLKLDSTDKKITL